MKDSWSSVPLSHLLAKSEDWIDLETDTVYREVTVRLWGKGVVERRRVLGAEIGAGRRFVVRSGQFILSRIDARNGALGIVPDELDGAVVSNDFPAFTINSDVILPSFLAWLSRTHGFVDLCRAASEGTTNRVRLQESRFLATPIPLPPLAEQQRIVARIEELAGKIEEARGLRREAERALEALLREVYRQAIEGAPVHRMVDVAPLVRRPVLVEVSETYHELGVRSFGKGTFHKATITGASLGTKKVFGIQPGDLLFNIVFAWEGAVAVARPEDEGRIGSHRFLTCVPKENVATGPFLCYHFLTEHGLRQIGEASPGGAGRNRTLGLSALAEILVPVPPIEKQLWFDSIQKRADSIRRLRAESAELDALLPSILDRAFKGEL